MQRKTKYKSKKDVLASLEETLNALSSDQSAKTRLSRPPRSEEEVQTLWKKALEEIFLAMSDKGINNSVATLGIATNRFHAQTLLRLVDEVIFCFIFSFQNFIS